MKQKLNRKLASGFVIAGSLLLASVLSAQAPAGGAPAMGGFGGFGGGQGGQGGQGGGQGGMPAMGGFGGGQGGMPAMGGFGGGQGQGGPRANVNTISQIQEKFPDEYKAAQQLRQSDPASYRVKLRELQQKLGEGN